MAETLTFENNTEVTTIDNLNADEQESLEVGEQMQAAEDSRLAGKYENAEQLEKAYIELEKKLAKNLSRKRKAKNLQRHRRKKNLRRPRLIY